MKNEVINSSCVTIITGIRKNWAAGGNAVMSVCTKYLPHDTKAYKSYQSLSIERFDIITKQESCQFFEYMNTM